MKIAVLIQCHKSSKQINMLLDTLAHEDIDIYIHVDKKFELIEDLKLSDNIFVLPDECRVDVQWACYSQVQATLNLLSYASKNKRYDYFCLLSGQCFPIVSAKKIAQYLEKNNGVNYVNLFKSLNNGAGKTNNYDKRNNIRYSNWILKRSMFIRIIRRLWVAITGGYNYTFNLFKRKPVNNLKFYFGSSWWCINIDFVDWLLDYLHNNPNYIEFFKKSCCADESFFQTLLMNSLYADTRKDYLHYIDWTEGKSSPKNLQLSDLENIRNSQKLFARKIDENFELIDKLREGN